MIKEGLICKPEFDNKSKYLKFGNRTNCNEKIIEIANSINEPIDGLTVRKILLWINQNTVRIHDEKDERKFKRSSTEILESRERTGCCDSSTLFTSIARCKGIPTMQIVTINKDTGRDGHFYVASYLKDTEKIGRWILIDTDAPIKDIRDVRLVTLDLNDRNISKRRYAYAYTEDYNNIELDGIRIDSIQNMNKLQNSVWGLLDKEDFINKLRE